MEDYYSEVELEEIFVDFALVSGLDTIRFEALLGYFNDLSEKGKEQMVHWMIEEMVSSSI
jgi:hypothetical protein